MVCYHFAMTHTDKKMCFTVEVFVVHEDKVLLRMHDKYKFWCSVGGHIDEGEDPNQAAIREVKEEVGLDITLWDKEQKFHAKDGALYNIIPPAGINRHSTNDGHEHVTMIYFATSHHSDVVPEKESDEWRWVSKDELETMDRKPNIREYAGEALRVLGTRS